MNYYVLSLHQKFVQKLRFTCRPHLIPEPGRKPGARVTNSAHPRPQAQAREALTVALVQAVELRWISDAEAWSLSICIAP